MMVLIKYCHTNRLRIAIPMQGQWCSMEFPPSRWPIFRDTPQRACARLRALGAFPTCVPTP